MDRDLPNGDSNPPYEQLGRERDSNPALCNADAVLYQLIYQANLNLFNNYPSCTILPRDNTTSYGLSACGKKGNRNTVLELFYTVVISKTLCMNHISFFQ